MAFKRGVRFTQERSVSHGSIRKLNVTAGNTDEFAGWNGRKGVFISSHPFYYEAGQPASSQLIRRRSGVMQRTPTVHVSNTHNENQQANLRRETQPLSQGPRTQEMEGAIIRNLNFLWVCAAPSFLFFFLSCLEIAAGKVKR